MQTIDVLEVGADIAIHQTGCVEADNLIIHPINPGLALLHQFGREAAAPAARHGDRQLAVLALQSFG